MTKGISHKAKQFLFELIKLSLVIGAFYFIYFKLTHNDQLSTERLFTFIHGNNLLQPYCLVSLLVLTMLNWLFEILKWQTLVSHFKTIYLKQALQQCLGSHTASIFTPNRIGEYGAKAMYYFSFERKKVVALNLLSHMFQMAATTVFGVVGMLLFGQMISEEIPLLKILGWLAVFGIIIMGVYFLTSKKSITLKGNSIQDLWKFYRNLSQSILLKTGLYSILRYAIFSFQFYLLLRFTGNDMSYFLAMIVITTMYFLASIIPSISIFDVVIKGSVAMYLFSFLGVPEVTTLCISTMMWLLNFVLPSVAGSFFVLTYKTPSLAP